MPPLMPNLGDDLPPPPPMLGGGANPVGGRAGGPGRSGGIPNRALPHPGAEGSSIIEAPARIRGALGMRRASSGRSDRSDSESSSLGDFDMDFEEFQTLHHIAQGDEHIWVRVDNYLADPQGETEAAARVRLEAERDCRR